MRKRGMHTAAVGFVFFFLTMATVASVSVLVYARVSERFGSSRPVTAVLLLLLITFLALACSTIDLLRRKSTVEKPLLRILDATDKITRGDFSVRIEPVHAYGKYDEYDVIADNINEMAEALGKNEALNADFVANVSHEIKTPLAVIQNYATALASGKADEETKKRYLETLMSATRRLTVLVGDVLKLNKLENGRLKGNTELTNITELVAESVLAFEDAVEKKGIVLECELDEVSLVTIPSHVELVCNNLMSNAVKFTERGGTVTVTLRGSGEGARLTVSDTGCGFGEDTGKRIFDKFYQGDTSHADEGNGLGLALVKKVIDDMGGEISVKSEVGKGSSFTVVMGKTEK